MEWLNGYTICISQSFQALLITGFAQVKLGEAHSSNVYGILNFEQKSQKANILFYGHIKNLKGGEFELYLLPGESKRINCDGAGDELDETKPENDAVLKVGTVKSSSKEGQYQTDFKGEIKQGKMSLQPGHKNSLIGRTVMVYENHEYIIGEYATPIL